jgi:hypothetical protein
METPPLAGSKHIVVGILHVSRPIAAVPSSTLSSTYHLSRGKPGISDSYKRILSSRYGFEGFWSPHLIPSSRLSCISHTFFGILETLRG